MAAEISNIDEFLEQTLKPRIGQEQRRVLILGRNIGSLAMRLAEGSHTVTAISDNARQMEALHANLRPLRGQAYELPLEPDELEPILRRGQYGLVMARNALQELSVQRATRVVKLMQYATIDGGYNVVIDRLREGGSHYANPHASPAQIRKLYDESSEWGLSAQEELAWDAVGDAGISFDLTFVAARRPRQPYSPDWS